MPYQQSNNTVMKTELKRVFIPCEAEEYLTIVQPTLLANGCWISGNNAKWEDGCIGAAVFGDEEFMTVAREIEGYTTLTLEELQKQYPLATYFTFHANDVNDAEAIVNQVCACEVDGNEIVVPRYLRDEVAAALFDARVTYVVSNQPCKSKQR